ncbi:H-NS family nucleoid-associated regulatory protein [Burkholderia anthina]|uniref:H-NS histone family protein n=1 Tax=Burkholderia anthina TaxID=179879 RepID=UPI0015888C31|nr:H-NS histone family protein [Burkholderia anthina]
MSRYTTLLAQYDQLKFEIEREMQMEGDRVATLVATRVREVLEAFGFEMDVVPRSKQPMPLATRKRTVAPRYWNPQTGQTWSGRGRTPHWIAGKDREQYRIGATADDDAKRHVPAEAGGRSGTANGSGEPGRSNHDGASASRPDPSQPLHDDKKNAPSAP